MQNVKICDVTLRDISASNTNLTFKEKLELCKKLDELNIDTLEISSSKIKSDEILIKTLTTLLKNTTIGYVPECNEESIEKGFSLISNAKNKKIILKIPVSSVKMEYFFNKKQSVVLDLLKALTLKAVSLCDTEVCFDDATRSESSFLFEAVKTAVACGVKAITISDQVGYFDPNQFKDFIADIIKNVPEMKNVELNVECCDSFSMATASVINSLECGISGIKLSVLNLNNMPDFERFIDALTYLGEYKGYSVKINKTILSRVLNQISQIVTSKKNNLLSTENMPIENLSDKYTMSELGKLLKKRGYDLSTEDLTKVYQEIQKIGEKKSLTTKDLDSIVAVTALQVPETYSLVSYSVNCSNLLSSTASVVLKTCDKEIKGISFGNGSIDSAFLAIENAIGRHFDLDDFAVSSVTEGQEAMGETIIKLRNDGKVYSGRGISTDIVGASIKAYMNALNKIVYEEKE